MKSFYDATMEDPLGYVELTGSVFPLEPYSSEPVTLISTLEGYKNQAHGKQ